MALHNEIEFENDICDHLAANGWLLSVGSADSGYCPRLAMFLPDVIEWVRQTEPQAWETLQKNHGVKAEATLLERLRSSLDQKGTLDVLRHGFDVHGLKQPLKMAQFKPASSSPRWR